MIAFTGSLSEYRFDVYLIIPVFFCALELSLSTWQYVIEYERRSIMTEQQRAALGNGRLEIHCHKTQTTKTKPKKIGATLYLNSEF